MECSICINKICNKCTLYCCHSFCYSCIEKWGNLKESCPICRSDFSMKQINKNARITRSMSKNSREKNLIDYLNKILYEINNMDSKNGILKNYKIGRLFHIFYINDWIFNCITPSIPKHICICDGCVCRKVVIQKINEFSKMNWKGLEIWKFKFRKYMQNKS